jgi:predicted nucleic acid-binding protein
MSKAAKKTKAETASHSVLKLAYEAFDRGDVVLTRQLVLEVLAGKVGKDDADVAKALAKELSSPEAPVDESPQAVAQELLRRTKVMGKPYLMAGAVAAVYLLLVVLAAVRY